MASSPKESVPREPASGRWSPDGPAYLALLAVGCLALAAYTGRKAGVAVDDLFITLAFAKNLAAGEGMAFQAGERVFAVTTPLWCWLNAGVMAAWPAARGTGAGAWLLAQLSHAAAGFLAERVARRCGAGWASPLAAAAWLLHREHVHLFGMEHGLATALAFGAVLLHLRGRWAASGVACALLALARPDAALLAVALFGVLLARKDLRAAGLFAAPPAVVGAASLAGFWLYFGSPIPSTLSTKQEQLGALPWLSSVGSAAKDYLLVEVLRGPLLGALAAVAGFFALAGRARGFWILAGWAAAHVAVLTALGVGHYSWYLWPLWMALAVASAAGAGALARAVPDPLARRAVAGAGAVLLLAGWQAPWAGDPASKQHDRRDSYIAVAARAAELADGRPASLLASEIGVLRFRLPANIAILDEALLVTPSPVEGRFPHRGDFVLAHEPEFIVESHPVFPGMPEAARAAIAERVEGFSIAVERPGGGVVAYRLDRAARSGYGLIALLVREDLHPARAPGQAGDEPAGDQEQPE